MFRKPIKPKDQDHKSDEQSSKKCPFLYVDIFGHPYCTAETDKALECEFCVPSEEYVEMRRQLEMQGQLNNKNNPFQAPSTYRCTVLDKYADPDGHLPPKYRSKLPEGMGGVTGFFD
ncbi:hypothetical protein J7L48_09610 [bacterium]|nr:hypothetical protein [bacterium]